MKARGVLKGPTTAAVYAVDYSRRASRETARRSEGDSGREGKPPPGIAVVRN